MVMKSIYIGIAALGGWFLASSGWGVLTALAGLPMESTIGVYGSLVVGLIGAGYLARRAA